MLNEGVLRARLNNTVYPGGKKPPWDTEFLPVRPRYSFFLSLAQRHWTWRPASLLYTSQKNLINKFNPHELHASIHHQFISSTQ